ncbi:MAG: hypothetical protein SOZ83_05345 [Sphaerochaetaceae bacterium]|nr:hypothetical protein [Sphaerochaetaceae bacterium]
MKDYSKKCLQLAIDELRKTCINKGYADKKIQYMKRYYGKLYTEEEIIKEAQALINEGADEIYIGVKIAKVDYRGIVEYTFGTTAYLWSDRYVPYPDDTRFGSAKKSIYEYYGDENVIGYTIEGASCDHGDLMFYFSHDDKAKEIWENEIYGTNNNDKPNLLEFNEFGDTWNIRNYILDNRDEYDGYIIRSNNCWDKDTTYLWQERANGEIIWRKQK